MWSAKKISAPHFLSDTIFINYGVFKVCIIIRVKEANIVLA